MNRKKQKSKEANFPAKHVKLYSDLLQASYYLTASGSPRRMGGWGGGGGKGGGEGRGEVIFVSESYNKVEGSRAVTDER